MSKEKNEQKRLFNEKCKLDRMLLFSRYLELKEKLLDSLDIEEINILSDCYRVFGITSIQYNIEDLVSNYHHKLL